MRLKKLKQNTVQLFCALFVLGMNVYGVDSTFSRYASVARSDDNNPSPQEHVDSTFTVKADQYL